MSFSVLLAILKFHIEHSEQAFTPQQAILIVPIKLICLDAPFLYSTVLSFDSLRDC
ncbi:hypothetical protein OIU78_001345 [Salix suchowensis]|nr:hypothetical protein OIU78_001345 [Salix suchowensis]